MEMRIAIGYHLDFPNTPMFHVALYEPEIPPNTGNVARLCAATETVLHIVGVPGFRMDDRTLKRAGLDYWEHVELRRHLDFPRLFESLPESRFVYVETGSSINYSDYEFREGDCLVYGRETRGLPDEMLEQNRENWIAIPMFNHNVRSLNLANSVAIVLYEAIRQTR